MKKKGLIVATIVMVLVLAVSLTTATYAWFTAANKTIIEAIDFAVGSSSDVLIGVKTQYAQDSNYKTNVTTDSMTPGSQAGYIWGSLTGENDYTYAGGASTWINGTPGLGHYIDTGLTLTNIAMAIGTGTIDSVTPANSTVDDAAWVSTNSIIKAEASKTADAIADGEGAELATPQEDYLDIVLGVKPAKANLTSITLNITINPDQNTKTVIGMNSAIHVIFGIEQAAPTKPTATNAYTTGMKSGEIDVYGNHHYGTNVSTISSASTFAAQGFNTSTETLNAGWTNLAIVIATPEDGQQFLPVNDFYQIHLIIFIAGYDTDCVQSAMGVGADICLNFTAEEGTVA